MADEFGQNMVEYGLLMALISVAVMAVLILLGPHLVTLFQTVDTQLPPQQP